MRISKPNLKGLPLLLVGSLVILFIIFFNSFFVIIEAGTVGVKSTFGKVADEEFQSGFNFKNPFTQVIRMNIRTTSYTMSSTYSEGEVQGDDSIQALAKDGGIVWFDVTVLYRLVPDQASDVYRSLGVNYQENVIRPQIRSTIREVSADYAVNELYSTKRDEVQNNIFENLKNRTETRGIIVEEVLLRKVTITDKLSQSIEAKLAAEQEVQRQEFEIQKAEKEAERKVVEARGQKEAQEIINSSLTDKYLYYLYINELQSREGTIYIPINPENGVPLFKNIPD